MSTSDSKDETPPLTKIFLLSEVKSICVLELLVENDPNFEGKKKVKRFVNYSQEELDIHKKAK